MNTIECPKCKYQIPIDQALEEQARNKFNKEKEEEYKKQTLDLMEQIRKLQTEKFNTDIEVKKRVIIEQDKIMTETKKKVEEEYQLKIAEKDKQLLDAQKAADEFKRKAQQGSQQTQGEVLELKLEEILKLAFSNDEIKPVPKGIRGADIVQEVKDKYGHSCGTILWELKNAEWSDSWISKLKIDQNTIKANFSVLVTVNLPKDIKDNFFRKDDVWITNQQSLTALAYSLRYNLIKVFYVQSSFEGKNEKMDILYKYLVSDEFRLRIESIANYFSEMQNDLEKEKRWCQLKWAKQEKNIRHVIDQTCGMYGDLQGIVGAQQLPELKTLQIEAENENRN